MVRPTLARLTLETAMSHAEIDEALLGPLEFPTAGAYRRFLAILYGFLAPLEAAVAVTPAIDLDFVEDRCKAGRIASDLMALGLTRHEYHLLARRQAIGPFATPAEALGWLYSTERLMLKIDGLRSRLATELPITLGLAGQFITSYEHVAEIRWRHYGAALERAARRYGTDAIVAGAHAGLASLADWIVQCGAYVAVTPVEQRASA